MRITLEIGLFKLSKIKKKKKMIDQILYQLELVSTLRIVDLQHRYHMCYVSFFRGNLISIFFHVTGSESL